MANEPMPRVPPPTLVRLWRLLQTGVQSGKFCLLLQRGYELKHPIFSTDCIKINPVASPSGMLGGGMNVRFAAWAPGGVKAGGCGQGCPSSVPSTMDRLR